MKVRSHWSWVQFSTFCNKTICCDSMQPIPNPLYNQRNICHQSQRKYEFLLHHSWKNRSLKGKKKKRKTNYQEAGRIPRSAYSSWWIVYYFVIYLLDSVLSPPTTFQWGPPSLRLIRGRWGETGIWIAEPWRGCRHIGSPLSSFGRPSG